MRNISKTAKIVRAARKVLTQMEADPERRRRIAEEMLAEVCFCYQGHSLRRYSCPNHTVCDADVQGVFDTMRELKAWETTHNGLVVACKHALSKHIKIIVEREKSNKPATSPDHFNPPPGFPDGVLGDYLATPVVTRDQINTIFIDTPRRNLQSTRMSTTSTPTATPVQTPVAILVRVSTNAQDTARQVTELQAYADLQGYKVVRICEEKVSGNAEDAERQGLLQVVELARAGAIRKVLVHEVSRIARKNSIAHNFIEVLENLGVSLYWKSQNVETLLPSGKRNPAAGIMFALLSEMARAERETLIERVRSGLDAARRNGVVLGRPKGRLCLKAFLRKHADIVRKLKAGHSVRNTASIIGASPSTVQKVRSALDGLR